MKDKEKELNKIIDDITKYSNNCIRTLMFNPEVLKKHEVDTFKKQSILLHLTKSIRHITTHLNNKELGVHDGEYHLSNAITRLAMAIYLEMEEE